MSKMLDVQCSDNADTLPNDLKDSWTINYQHKIMHKCINSTEHSACQKTIYLETPEFQIQEVFLLFLPIIHINS